MQMQWLRHKWSSGIMDIDQLTGFLYHFEFGHPPHIQRVPPVRFHHHSPSPKLFGRPLGRLLVLMPCGHHLPTRLREGLAHRPTQPACPPHDKNRFHSCTRTKDCPAATMICSGSRKIRRSSTKTFAASVFCDTTASNLNLSCR